MTQIHVNTEYDETESIPGPASMIAELMSEPTGYYGIMNHKPEEIPGPPSLEACLAGPMPVMGSALSCEHEGVPAPKHFKIGSEGSGSNRSSPSRVHSKGSWDDRDFDFVARASTTRARSRSIARSSRPSERSTPRSMEAHLTGAEPRWTSTSEAPARVLPPHAPGSLGH